MNKVLLIIPAYNEEANIQMVVEELRDHYPELDYVVVNDRSRDQSFRSSGEFRAGRLFSGGYEICLLQRVSLRHPV